jgi:hypothetical protein
MAAKCRISDCSLEQSRFAFNCKKSDQYHDPDGTPRCKEDYDQAFVETPALHGRLAAARPDALVILGDNQLECVGETLGRPPGRSDDPLTEGLKMGTTLVGSVETVVKGIEKLWELSSGGFGGVLFRAHNWANREQTLKSYKLFARYVISRSQGSADGPRNSNEWARGNRKTGARDIDGTTTTA